MDDEKLIELVRNEPILYSKFHIGYRFPDKKMKIWKTIAEKLGATDEDCKKRWTSLRERFSRECKRMNAPSGSGAVHMEGWPLFQNLSFLKEHVKPRPTRCTVNVFEDNSEDSTSLLLPPPSSLPSSSPSPLPLSSPSLLPSSSPLQSPKPAEAAASSSSARGKKRRYNAPYEEDFREACKSFTSLCNEPKKNEAVHACGQMIVATVCSMSARSQANAMVKLTQLVMKLKEDDEASCGFELID